MKSVESSSSSSISSSSSSSNKSFATPPPVPLDEFSTFVHNISDIKAKEHGLSELKYAEELRVNAVKEGLEERRMTLEERTLEHSINKLAYDVAVFIF